MKIYKITRNSKIFKENLWSVLLINTNVCIVVTDITNNSELVGTIEITKLEFFNEILKYEDSNFIIYYKQIEQYLVGFLLDFFVYYIEEPYKIKTITDDNLTFYEFIKNQKLK